MIISLESDKVRLVVNTDKILWDTLDQLDDAIAQVKKKHSLYSEYPMEEGEDQESWYERVSPLLMEKNKKKAKETNAKFFQRFFKTDMTKQEYIKDALIAVAKVFDGQDTKLTEEVLKTVPYVKAKQFLKEVSQVSDIPIGGLE